MSTDNRRKMDLLIVHKGLIVLKLVPWEAEDAEGLSP
jgi:hypothetical protein